MYMLVIRECKERREEAMQRGERNEIQESEFLERVLLTIKYTSLVVHMESTSQTVNKCISGHCL